MGLIMTLSGLIYGLSLCGGFFVFALFVWLLISHRGRDTLHHVSEILTKEDRCADCKERLVCNDAYDTSYPCDYYEKGEALCSLRSMIDSGESHV